MKTEKSRFMRIFFSGWNKTDRKASILKKKKYMAAAWALALGIFFLSPVFAVWARESENVVCTASNDSRSGDGTQKMGSEEMEKIFDYIREKWNSGELSTREDVERAIEEGCAEFGINLDEKKKEQLADLVEKAKELGLDSDFMKQEAKKLYEEYGEEFVSQAADLLKEQVAEPVKEAVADSARELVKDFFHDLKESVTDFFHSLLL